MIEHQVAAVRDVMAARPAGLVEHVERVLREARSLAASWDVDPQRVELAVWGHDLFRADDDAAQLRLAAEYGITVSEADRAKPLLLHGPNAAAFMRRDLGIDDDDVLEAVRCHTFGAPEANSVARILLLADKVEAHKRRSAPQLRGIRRLAARDLDTALLCWSDWHWFRSRRKGWDVHPAHWRARQAWVEEHHVDLGVRPRALRGDTG